MSIRGTVYRTGIEILFLCLFLYLFGIGIYDVSFDLPFTGV